ncbi:hypothetical protein L485_03780 [Sphingobium baderi LL03]|uniref:Uncharacterized protein n=1 Tax=Sphingobium baderi LL03 TaxID=1114964 RepID=T0GVN0_9SPHN|nr:hypothetical protein L485_03780 [Sphingobium baderi LL03]
MLVGPTAGHAAHHLQRILRCCTTVLAGFRLANPQFRVLIAPPMDCEHDVTHGIIDIDDDFGDQCA